MRLLVTGANGFLGRYVVAEALARGHRVRAVVRPASSLAGLAWADSNEVEIRRCDLRSRAAIGDLCSDVDAVLHLAADKSGDLHAQLAGTVLASENLLQAAAEAGIARWIGISTFSVYDYLRPRAFARIDESSALEAAPETRDEYARTKLFQELLTREFCAAHRIDWTILRPGVIWGRESWWSARLGLQLGRGLWLRTGAWARLPLSYVENTADAILCAVEHPEAGGQIINVLDDEMPSQRRFVSLLRRHQHPRPQVLRISWTLMKAACGLAALANQLFFGGNAKIPGLLSAPKLYARIRPLRYSNRRLHEVLAWQQPHSLDVALERCFAPDGQALGRLP